MAIQANSSLNKVELPTGSYYLSEKNAKEKYEHENHIIKTPSMIRSGANKLANNVFVYAPKGMKGSINSNFHEYLSLGSLPYIAGCVSLAALYNVANKFYDIDSRNAANKLGRKMGLGIALYALGKFLGKKVIETGVKQTTGIDSNLTYKKVIHEIPENKNQKPKSSVEFHKVFESVDFPRWDLIEAKSNHEDGNRYSYYDKIAKKMGYKEKLNSPDQLVQGKIQNVLVKANAAKNVSSYLWAATGVALAFQPAFDTLANIKKPNKNIFKYIKNNYKNIIKNTAGTFRDAFKSLWHGNGKRYSGTIGKILILGSIGSSILGVLNAKTSFKAVKENKQAKIDFSKKYEEV